MADYFWRGGEKVFIQKEPQYFTAIIANAHSLQRIEQLKGVEEVVRIQDGIYRVKADAKALDKAMDTIRSGAINEVVHHAYHPVGNQATRYYLTDKITVRFKPETSHQEIEDIMQQTGLKLFRQYPGEDKLYLFEVTDSAGKNPIKVTNDLAEREEVIYAEPELINRFKPLYIPTDTLFDKQWHLQSREDVELTAGADISAPEAWDMTKGTRQVVVAVIDDGFDLSHPDLSGEGKIVFAKDYVDGDKEPFPTVEDGDYHGTPCAGVAIGEENGEGIVGAAPGCAFMPVRINIGAIQDHELWQVFDETGQHADVISNSWGPVPVYAPLPSSLKEKFTQLSETGGPRGKGCLILFAAGNYNAPIHDPDNKYFVWYHPDYGEVTQTGPILNGNAAHPDVMAVAASTSQNRKAAYSNWGKEISVSAPSNNFHPINYRQKVPGRGIWTTDNEVQGQGFTPNSRYTGDFGGTSSATPLAAGVAALVFSANPTLTAKEVKQILQQTADKITDPIPDPVLGNTKGTYDADGHSEWFGYGKVNAAKAVAKALETADKTVAEIPSNGGSAAQNQESQRIRGLLTRTYSGEAWHGPSVTEVLADVDIMTASRRVTGSHNISELIRHMTAWRQFAIARLEGDDAYEVREEDNWQHIPFVEKADWQEAIDRLEQSQQKLIILLESIEDDKLKEVVANRPYSFYVLLHGIIQHDLSHLGQISLLKKSALSAV